MRTRTLASLIILCGSTAALAQMTTPAQTPETQNNVTTNDAQSPDTSPANETQPDASQPENKLDTGDDQPPQQQP